MKVIHLISGGDVGGAKTHVLSLLQGLNQSEIVHLVCFTEGAFADEARQLGIPTTVLPGKNLFSVRKRLISMILHGGYEIIHCHGARANLMGALLKKKLSLPVVTTVHSDYRLDYLGRPVSRLTYGNINKIALNKLDYWIGVSDAMKKLLISRGFDPQRVFSIYNGVDFSERTVKLSREDFLRSLNVPFDDDTTVFGIAARISPIKDMTTLITAFSAAMKTTPNIRLVIAGDGEQAAEMKLLAQRLCPEGTVFFAGWLDDTDSFYNALDVNMLTSLSEGFPYVLPEGARWHCATISSNVGGIPLLIDDGVNGLLFNPQDTQTLSAHISRMATDKDTRREMADQLYEKAYLLCSVTATVSKQKEIYQTVIRRSARFEHTRDGVIICGAYGKGNGGDDFILEEIISQMKQIDPDIPLYVLSRKPKQTMISTGINSIHTFRYLKMRRVMKRTKLYISGGGTLMQDVTSTRSLLYYLSNLKMAKKCGNQTILYGCGIGPISRPKNRTRAANILNKYADCITLRDDYSQLTLSELGVIKPEVHLTADPALLCDVPLDAHIKSYLLSQGIKDGEKYILFALRPWKDFEKKVSAFAAAAEYAYRTLGLIPVLYGMEPGRDMSALELVENQISCPHLMLPAPSESRLIVGLIKRMSIVVSMRLHALIFAAGQGVPLVGVVYDPKVSGFLDYIGQDQYLSLNDINIGNLNDMIDGALSAAVAEPDAVRKLRELADINRQAAERLLEK